MVAFLIACWAALPAHAAAPARAVSLPEIADPAYAVVSSSASAGQYDSRTFVPEGQAKVSFAQAMERENLHLGQELRTRLEQALTNAGLRVANANGNAEITVAFSPEGARYSDAVLGDDLTPSYSVLVRLSLTSAMPLEFRISYGEGGDGIVPDANYRFTSPDALISGSAAAAEGLRAGLPLIAAEIAAITRMQIVP